MNNVIDYKDILKNKTDEMLGLNDLGEDYPEKLIKQVKLLSFWRVNEETQSKVKL